MSGKVRTPHPAAPRPPSPFGRGKERRILVGEFGRAQGVRGEVRMTSYTADPAAIAGYSPLESEDGKRAFHILSLRAQGSALVARVEGVTDRAAAEALTRTKLYVPRERLALKPSADEYLLADLIGLAAVTDDGSPFGDVVAVPNYGAGDLVEIMPSDGGPTLLLPFAEPFVGEVDIAAGRLVVRPPEEA